MPPRLLAFIYAHKLEFDRARDLVNAIYILVISVRASLSR